jgi:excinuclease UvrABC nuclease subunit
MAIGAGVPTYQWDVLPIIQEAPRQSGVYAIYGLHGCIYVGESGDIRASLLRHYGEENSCIMWNAPTSFQFLLVPSSLRVFQKNQLILALQPICNRHEERSG